MKNILFILALTLTLSNCSWIWDKSQKLGEYMPVSSSAERCRDRVYCGSGSSAPQPEQMPMPPMADEGYPSPQAGGYPDTQNYPGTQGYPASPMPPQ